jgi:hypothetical protein
MYGTLEHASLTATYGCARIVDRVTEKSAEYLEAMTDAQFPVMPIDSD